MGDCTIVAFIRVAWTNLIVICDRNMPVLGSNDGNLGWVDNDEQEKI